MQDTACLGLVHGDDPEKRYGEGGGRGVHVWERMYTRGGFMSMYGKLRKAFLSLLAILWNSAFKWVHLSFSPLDIFKNRFNDLNPYISSYLEKN